MPYIRIYYHDIKVGDVVVTLNHHTPWPEKYRPHYMITKKGRKYIYHNTMSHLGSDSLSFPSRNSVDFFTNRIIYKYIDYANLPKESV